MEVSSIDCNEQSLPAEEQVRILQNRYSRLLDILGAVVESRSLGGGAHIDRIKNFTRVLAEEVMNSFPEYVINPYMVEVIVSASVFHDIGKITIPDAILFKPGRLSREEFEYMKTHTIRGCEILDSIEGAWSDDFRKTAHQISRHHHEKYDGTGYPDGLKGEEIPENARIICLADCYDAMSSDRSYRKALPQQMVRSEIENGRGTQFDPMIVSTFLDMLGEKEL